MAQGSPAGLESHFQMVTPLKKTEVRQTKYGIPNFSEAELIRSVFEMRISALEGEIRKIKKESIGYLKINLLPNKTLCVPLDVIVEADEDKFIARTVDLPLYGHGEEPIEAIDMLKREIESLHDDLMSGNDFTEEWLKIKRFLVERISD
jgi:hypothetical protein